MPLFGEGGKGEGEGEGEVIQRKGAMARSLRVEFRIWAVKVAIKQPLQRRINSFHDRVR